VPPLSKNDATLKVGFFFLALSGNFVFFFFAFFLF